MGSAAVLSNGLHQTNQQPNYNAEYEKILTLRDEIFSDKHPRLKLSKASPATAPPTSVPVVPRTNGISMPSPMKAVPVQNGVSNMSSLTASVPKSTAQRAPTSLPISDFDPVLLTKGPALVREEMLRKRRAIEQSLRDQVSQKKRFSRQKLLEEEGLPDFDVTQVFERAHDIVKPVRFAQVKVANRHASSSSSFDENDYYSSQVNSWTTTEPEADASPKRHASSKEIEAGGAQAMDIDSVDADEQARPRSRPVVDPNVGAKDEVAAQAARIAELEEKLRLATEKNATVNRVQTPIQEEGQIEEPEYSPPDVQQPPVLPEPQIHAQILDTDRAQQREPALRRSSRPLPPQSREYAARNEPAPSPIQNDMRIVRNHITSPLAPQPARVSPLAVAKAPPVSQIREIQQDERRGPKAGPANPGSKRVSPDQPIQPLTNRKRRRGKNSGDMVRNVAPRRENLSPEIRVKEEPVSPQLRPTTLEAWRPPRTEEVQRPVYVDTISPQRRGSNNGGPAPRRNERLAQVQMSEPGRPFSPVERRNVHGNGHFIEINDEPDLRRVATTRQIHMPPPLPEQSKTFRASVQPQPVSRYYPDQPLSPAPHHPQRAPSRHASIAMAPPQPRIVVDQYGNRFVEAPAPQERQMSILPITRPDEHDPRYEQSTRPTIIRNSSYELGPDGLQYVRRVPSPTSPRYVQRAPSPVSPRYVQRAPSPVSPRYARPINHFEQGGYIDESYSSRGENSVRVIGHADDQGAARFDNFTRPREPVTRLQSVRPVSHYEASKVQSVRPEQERVVNLRPVPVSYDAPRIQSIQPERGRMASVRPMTGQHEMPREQFARVQSVRPEQERIVSLGGRREMIPRPVSVRPEDTYVRPAGPYVDDRPMYTYVPEPQERRYVEEGAYNDRVVYEAPGSGSRRNV